MDVLTTYLNVINVWNHEQIVYFIPKHKNFYLETQFISVNCNSFLWIQQFHLNYIDL